MKKNLLILVLFAIIGESYCQQMPFFSQYTLNHYAINPAATGISNDIPLALSYRKQWANFPQSPSVQYLSGHMKIQDDMGVGAKLTNYKAGPLRKTGLELTYSYHFLLQKDLNLSFGLSGLFYQFHLDKSSLTVEEPDDEIFLGKEKMFVIDAIFGTYLYSKNYFVGLSIPQLVNRNIDLKKDNVLQEKQVRHYYLHGGYKFDINSDLTLEPSVLIKFIGVGLYQVDINAMAEYNDMVSFGLSLRTSDAMVFQFSYHYKDFRLGYSYDLTISRKNVASPGSHEILFIYSLRNFTQPGK